MFFLLSNWDFFLLNQEKNILLGPNQVKESPGNLPC